MRPSRRPGGATRSGRVRSGPCHMVGVRENLFNESPHMGIVGYVVDPGPITAGPNQPRQPQLGQVLRNPGRMGPHQRSQLID